MKKARSYSQYFLWRTIIYSMMVFVGCKGYQGVVLEKTSGRKIPEVKITFVKEDHSVIKSVIADNNGFYRVTLDRGRYWVTATHRDYEDYSSMPGFFIVTGWGYKTGNIFLREPQVTTVLLVRHAEKADVSGDPPLSPEGQTRAEKLAHVAHKAGVTAIYATDYLRTQQTVQPLVDFLKLETTLYTSSSIQELCETVMSEHNGDVVLVAGHSNTVPQIINLFSGGAIPTIGNEYDNLFVITVHGPGEAHVVNLQYGKSSSPDVMRGHHTLKTVLLVRHIEGNDDGLARAEKLAHVARTADVSTIFVEENTPAFQTVQPLADALGLQAVSYNSNDVPVVVEQILSGTARIFVLAGQKNTLSQIIKSLGGSPFPPIFANEYDNLFVITVHKFVEPNAKVVNLQYGELSP